MHPVSLREQTWLLTVGIWRSKKGVMQVEVKRVSIGQLSGKSFSEVARNGQYGMPLSSAKLKAFQNNPVLQSSEECAQLIGLVDGRMIGGSCPFPIRVVADGIVYWGESGSTLWVEPEYRKTGLAIDLLEVSQTLSPDKITIACGISHKARPIYRLMGFKVFTFQQVLWIRRSRGYLKNKLKGWMRVPGCFLLDRLLDIYGLWIRCAGRFLNASWSVQRVLPDEHDKIVLIEAMVKQDAHRFREDHNAAWFKWLLENNYCGESQQQSLYLAYKGGVLVGFFMLLVQNSQQENSETGGRIIEWGCHAGFEKLEPQLLLQAFLTFNRNLDVVALECAEKRSVRFLKRLGLIELGNQVMVIKALEDSPLLRHDGYDLQENWRMRPANGDHGFS